MAKKTWVWFLICNLIFMISTFIHECGHGLSMSLAGQPVSTGFGAIGNIYLSPKDIGFQSNLDLRTVSIFDMAVPITLLLTIVFSLIYCLHKFKRTRWDMLILSIALCNSVLRLKSCIFYGIIPGIPGRARIEDELGMGSSLVSITGNEYLRYLPIALSIFISVFCFTKLVLCLKRRHFSLLGSYMTTFVLAYLTSQGIARVLDNTFRINWIFLK